MLNREWREQRNSSGRLAEAYWKELAKGSKYADRMPIGVEHVVRQANSPLLRSFYRRWYRLQQMGAVVVGDLESVDEVCEMLRAEFGEARSAQARSCLGSPGLGHLVEQ